jgi:hypothetical protein
MGWNTFAKNKSLITSVVQVIQDLKITVNFIQWDNAGKHQQDLQAVCEKYAIQLEYTAPTTSQQMVWLKDSLLLIFLEQRQ